MNYRHVYMLVIEHAKSEQKSGLRPANHYDRRQKFSEQYFEFHHVLPRSLFPLWIKRKSNIVPLTAREHFFCHQLLTKIFPCVKMYYALTMMQGHDMKFFHATSANYESVRRAYNLIAQNIDDERREKIREHSKKMWATDGFREKRQKTIEKHDTAWFVDYNTRRNETWKKNMTPEKLEEMKRKKQSTWKTSEKAKACTEKRKGWWNRMTLEQKEHYRQKQRESQMRVKEKKLASLRKTLNNRTDEQKRVFSEKRRATCRKGFEEGKYYNFVNYWKNLDEEERKRRMNNPEKIAKLKASIEKRKNTPEYQKYREKLSQQMKEKMKGAHWWTDGKVNKLCKDCPGENFHLGRTIKNKQKA